nr:hypothetical chloroplast RF21 [Ipomoea batatas]GME02320.1 hypothetical chloroplast RF21 [Ipomoea batatas]
MLQDKFILFSLIDGQNFIWVRILPKSPAERPCLRQRCRKVIRVVFRLCRIVPPALARAPPRLRPLRRPVPFIRKNRVPIVLADRVESPPDLAVQRKIRDDVSVNPTNAVSGQDLPVREGRDFFNEEKVLEAVADEAEEEHEPEREVQCGNAGKPAE